MTVAPSPRRPRTLTFGVALLGVGLAAFFDGILLHQLLQWHHLVSQVDRYPMTTLDGLEANTVADGLFHLGALAVTLTAVALLLRARPFPATVGARWVLAWLLIGFGSFNIVEGVVDHSVLQIHRVREDTSRPWLWDMGFLVVNGLIVLAGVRLLRGARPTATGSIVGERVQP